MTPSIHRLLLACSILLSVPAYADYDFNNPAYRVQNTAEPDDSSAQIDAATARQRAAALRAERAERAEAASQPEQREWYVYTKNGEKIPYDQYVRDHPVRSGNYNIDHSDVSSSGGMHQDITPNTPTTPTPPTAEMHTASSGLHIFSVFLLMAIFGYLLYRRFFKTTPGTQRPPARQPRPPRPAQTAPRTTPHAAAQSGAVSLTAAAPLVAPLAAAPIVAAIPAPQPTPVPHPAEVPFEYERPDLSPPATPTVRSAPDSTHAADPQMFHLAAPPNWDGNITALVEYHLAALDQDRELQPLLYRTQLKKANLDYSADSLARIDLFLQQLRAKTHPAYADYATKADHKYLLLLLGMYVGTTLARVTNQCIKWFDYSSAKALNSHPNFVDQLQSTLSCVIGQGWHHLPIDLLCVILFGNDPADTCSARLVDYQAKATPLRPIPVQDTQRILLASNDQERAWVAAMKIAGTLAAHSVFIRAGAELLPTLLYPAGGTGNKLLFQSLVGADSDDYGRKMMINPDGHPCQALATDCYANLPFGRTDAISINARSYGSTAAHWDIFIPYRSKDHPDGFAIQTPQLVDSSVSPQLDELMMYAFYNGLQTSAKIYETWTQALQNA